MQCPGCNHLEARVVDSRTSRGGRAIRRRRECLSCGERFTTYEQVEAEPLLVMKRDGGSETYDRGKLLESIRVACAKRPVSNRDIESLVDEIEERLAAADQRDVASLRLGELVMDGLRALDQVAYVRFASVYRNFQDTTEFMEEVRQLGELLRRAGHSAAGQVELFSAGGDEGR
ncbi:MAG: transcriptional repressor NrdR [Gemmatimonadales bacterium]|uniref:transcriptional regulator NrdR n=1 Tax=Candidatus Palauibacter irciniicola TaxID=3056733 RepID=UPI001383E3C5|nr:transcriptional repressor NrdR [Candidatus Palauibacter irciniicola]MYC19012.1 transcriptional repressor NrdR [Gemmatimonadales bacterium]